MDRNIAFQPGIFDAESIGDFNPAAAYYPDMDFVEYLTIDALTVSRRVDEHLTILLDKRMERVVGFRLKGFRHLFLERLQPKFKLADQYFVLLASALESVVELIGEELFDRADDRSKAYQSAHELASQTNAKVYDLPLAA